MNETLVSDVEFVRFLQWCLPKVGLRWAGLRKVRGTVRKRLTRRMRELGLADLAAYRRKLAADPSEWRHLEALCRIPISRFYRDKAVYDFLAGEVLPSCAEAARSRKDRTVRTLSAGCASGEEPYTISLIWALRIARAFADVSLDVSALDVDDTMLRRARLACYAAGSLKDLPPDLRDGGFECKDGLYCLRDRFRRVVSLHKVDIRHGLFDGPFELILCRNTAFTYFDEATQKTTFAELDARLPAGGVLVIGTHESLPDGIGDYRRLAAKLPIYRKVRKGTVARPRRQSVEDTARD